jgi:hypothetical protein
MISANNIKRTPGMGLFSSMRISHKIWFGVSFLVVGYAFSTWLGFQ